MNNNTKFAKGMIVKTIKKDNWEIIRLGFEHEQFYENPINENGYINIVLKRSKKGEWYAVQDEWKPTQKETLTKEDYDFNQVSIDTSEIPF